MAVCEIQVHPADNTRMDLIIPGEQYFYLKARNAVERQKWLVALGTAKACLTDSRTQKEKEFTENTEALKTKMSELRLYCNLLVQQVHKTKEASISGVSEPESGIDMGALLKSTCDTFLKTLEECMQIANTAFTSELLHRTPPGSPPLAVFRSNKIKHSVLSSHTTTERQMELNPFENGSVKAEFNQQEQTLIKSLVHLNLETNEGSSDVLVEDHIEEDLAGECIKEDGESKLQAVEGFGTHKLLQSETDSVCGSTLSCEEDRNEKDFPTFFSVMSNRFSDIELREEEGIPTEEFLESCYAIVPVLDKLGPTVFAPVKMDFVGNIKKINQKFITNKEEFDTLQKIVLHEVNAGVAQVRNSATEALLWLKRGLKFLKGFLTEVKNGEKNIQTALIIDAASPQNATFLKIMVFRQITRQCLWEDVTATPWLGCTRGLCALRAAPTYEDFVAALSVEECDAQEETFYRGMQRDLNIYLPAMEKQLNILDTLYEVHGLESDEVV
ncbi:pleckstrin homology domain-containing family A member 8 isoform X3 [Apteryx mantelli]|nr:pleckstrin homology domain-containing family A member 8 isoform X3 [Apteryx rowi]XP_025945231.1 pleckstrin homology domain-containing family A member 8 isoform X3 [Apteryx rowi]XP_025945232.1 pleckstrin homology domain-containing family A member 8 isoform X3 [Apteryx rowi]XP_025945234.1 pleckstrin homology domain-containing family A member 8 isoform X3 [Apteryx rowi]XP_025945235.1 pleckstrin homology domain-containing family A member 8 isoform X3 [Apteryx rowi]XP_025945236.1 pleckstrin homo